MSKVAAGAVESMKSKDGESQDMASPVTVAPAEGTTMSARSDEEVERKDDDTKEGKYDGQIRQKVHLHGAVLLRLYCMKCGCEVECISLVHNSRCVEL